MRTRVTLVVIGVLMIFFAVFDAIGSPDLRVIPQLIRFAAVLILHDGVWMAIVAVVGIVIHRVIPVRYRSIVQGALIVTASVTIVALPLVLGFGYHADVPSALPRDYVGGYALVLGAIWLGAVALLVRRRLTAHPLPASVSPSPTSSGPHDSADPDEVG